MNNTTKINANGVEYTVEYVETVSRWTGTGYRDVIYRIAGTDDALVEICNPGERGYAPSRFEIREGFFAERREYARRASTIAKRYGVPFGVALAVANCPEWAIENLAGADVPEKALWELTCGIDRRKQGIALSIGTETYKALGIEGMGQKHSQAVADFLLENHQKVIAKYMA